jgi:hypothetical protein
MESSLQVETTGGEHRWKVQVSAFGGGQSTVFWGVVNVVRHLIAPINEWKGRIDSDGSGNINIRLKQDNQLLSRAGW